MDELKIPEVVSLRTLAEELERRLPGMETPDGKIVPVTPETEGLIFQFADAWGAAMADEMEVELHNERLRQHYRHIEDCLRASMRNTPVPGIPCTGNMGDYRRAIRSTPVARRATRNIWAAEPVWLQRHVEAHAPDAAWYAFAGANWYLRKG